MALTVNEGDTRLKLMTGAAGTEHAAMTSLAAKEFFDKSGLVLEIGRGTTDTDITYIALKDSNGDTAYIYPTTGGATATVSQTKP